ncbi:MAG: polymer-forming cytoskeletal protein [Lachnospiraceae bacterium]|nr:polymer-forming cytoskeletal protein [Lachnospiraceae bacterium]
MGFFSDLKDDLSQAVNELMPEEELKADADLQEEKEAEGAEEDFELDAMLEKLDSIQVPEDMDITKVEEKAAEPEAETAMQEDYDLEASLMAALAEKEEQDIEKDKEKEAVKMDVQMRSVSDETAIITAGMTITGDVASEGSLEVIGAINGNVDILGKLNITGTICGNSKAAEIYADNAKITGEISSEGSVKIGQSSVIIGNITAKSAVIAGAVKGDIDVQGPVILDTSAIVMGNIKSKSVQINNGAVIEGMCSQCYADVSPTSFFDEYKMNKK